MYGRAPDPDPPGPLELPPPAPLALQVVGRELRSPRMTRLRLRGPDLVDLRHLPGQDLMLAVPTGDTGPDGTAVTVNRRYTIRALDPVAGTVDLDAVDHGDGPGARWIAAAGPGDRIACFGPRGKIVASPTADWHLFVGDESGLPAIAVMLEGLPADAAAVALVEVADTREEQAIATPPATEIHWLHRRGDAPGTPERLVRALRAVTFPAGDGHAYLAAELGVVGALRDVLVERGFTPDAISPKAYWRRGAANAPHGEPMRDRV